jgi:hypothetical protein
LADGTVAPADRSIGRSGGQEQQAQVGAGLGSAELVGQLSRLAAVAGALDGQLAQRLKGCLHDLQQAEAEPASIEEMVWRNARSMECLAALQFSRLQLAQTEIY